MARRPGPEPLDELLPARVERLEGAFEPRAAASARRRARPGSRRPRPRRRCPRGSASRSRASPGDAAGAGSSRGEVERVDAATGGPTARRRAARRTCRPSRRGSRSRAPPRRRARAGRSGRRRRRRARRPRAPGRRRAGTSLIVPSAFDAAPIATSRVRGPIAGAEGVQVELARSRVEGDAPRTVTPRSCASARQGPTLAWWSSSVTTISSPGRPAPPERARRGGR